MTIIVKSKIEKGSIRLPKKVDLPEGTRVIVRIEPVIKTKEKHKIISELSGAWSDDHNNCFYFQDDRPGTAQLFWPRGKFRMILLDTNVVVAFLNGDKSILKRIRVEIDEIALSTLVVAELDYGAKVSQRSEENLEKLYRLVDIVQVIPFDIECAKVFGTIKSKLRSLGKPTGEVDALIAATAMAHEAILVTGQ